MSFVITRAGVKAQLQERSRARRASAKSRTEASASRYVRNDLLPDLEVVSVPINLLKLAKRHTRKANDAHIGAIRHSIQSFGQVLPVLLGPDGRIVNGHLVVEAARRLDLRRVNCVRLEHLSQDEARLLGIALNRLQEGGQWDLEPLALELGELEALEFDLGLTGFTIPELDAMLQPAVPVEADALPEEAEDPAPVSMIGDLWQCGPHRVLCGSATEPDAYERLMEGETAAAVLTDPPYNIKIKGTVSGLGQNKHDDFVMASGEMGDPEFEAFLTDFLAASSACCAKGAVVFAFMDWRQSHLLRLAGEAAKLRCINMIAWDKGSGGMGALYRSAHELVWVFCTADKPAINNVQLGKHGRDRTNVQHYPGANRPGSSAGKALKLHATPKPVELIADLVLDVTHPDTIVLDPFLGSGTALVAGETVNRIVYGIELDPKFVDVTVRRWQDYTGLEAIHAETGRTFAEIAAERGSGPVSGKEGCDHG